MRFHHFLAPLLVLPFLLIGCGNATQLNEMHESEALRLVNMDLAERVSRLPLETPGFMLKTIGRPGAGSYGGNGVFIGLVPTDGGKSLDVPLEYDYTYTVSEGDSKVHVTIIHSPSDEELRSAVSNAMGQSSHVRVSEPQPNAVITSPLTVTGEARGTWYFEASFPVKVLDDQGNQVGIGIAQAEGEWMTTDFVPFTAIVEFTTTASNGFLVLEKDNPSGLPENAAQVTIPVQFQP